jgi:hypothetical protein
MPPRLRLLGQGQTACAVMRYRGRGRGSGIPGNLSGRRRCWSSSSGGGQPLQLISLLHPVRCHLVAIRERPRGFAPPPTACSYCSCRRPLPAGRRMILLVVSRDGWSSVDVGGGKGRGRNGIAGPEELTGKGRGGWRGRERRIEVEQRRRAREEQRLREGFCSQTVPHVGARDGASRGRAGAVAPPMLKYFTRPPLDIMWC